MFPCIAFILHLAGAFSSMAVGTPSIPVSGHTISLSKTWRSPTIRVLGLALAADHLVLLGGVFARIIMAWIASIMDFMCHLQGQSLRIVRLAIALASVSTSTITIPYAVKSDPI